MNDGKICVSVCADTADEFIAKIRRAEEFADVIELRFDCLPAGEIDAVIHAITGSAPAKPLLATFRSYQQGGHRELSFEDRRAFWTNIPMGLWAVDLEEDAVDLAVGQQHKIVSHHDLTGVPVDLDALFLRLASAHADIVKIAVTANDVIDTIPVWRLLERARADNKRLIPIAMGDVGKWTRILGLANGAFMTYGSLETGSETAPGQITARDMAELYRVKELDGDTQVFGVIGDPISQSLSTYMHNPAFAATGINAVFIPFLVKDIAGFMNRMVRPAFREIELDFGGFSVTMPHKQSIMTHLDAIDPTAQKIGAVNTVRIANGKLTGYNTDAHGFITPLKANFSDLRGKRVAVCGAGGAARACVYALTKENADVTVFARDEQKAKLFADEFGVASAGISAMRDRPTKISDDFEILVDATPFGMNGPYENQSLFTASQLDGLKFVFDLVTKPYDTPIIREAKAVGVAAIGGLEMLVAQGVRQFEIWTGQTAPVEKMRESVLARISQLQK